ncbi:hypothetical protein SADUNF_Sadunf05G0045700 [Salix dunnii]|uniref:Uncharacterized protein n=1 Tax=Salix dunnii TaxID=1413687 RepID=A0A835K3Q0_9ROSI|nr:hypothetical protein SADUNF_Sadunf05G0045700 [Salix dunnii]
MDLQTTYRLKCWGRRTSSLSSGFLSSRTPIIYLFSCFLGVEFAPTYEVSFEFMSPSYMYWLENEHAATLEVADDKVTVLESEKRAWESSPEAQAIREALNPWRNHDTEQRKNT